jgi:pyruvate-formate lyase
MGTQENKMVGSKTSMEWRDNITAEVGGTERIKKLNRLLHSFRPSLDLHRTRCFTKVYKELEGCTEKRKMYFAMAETIATLPVVIYEHERILGWQGKKPRAENFSIEQHAHWMINELDTIPTREYDPWEISEEEKKELKEIHLPYWAGRTLVAKWVKRVPSPDKLQGSGIADCTNYIHNLGSHFLPDFPELLKIGFKGYYEKARVALENLDPNDPVSVVDKKDFYEGIIAVLEAIKKLAERYSNEAAERAKAEKNLVRKKELEKASVVLSHVPWNPATTFYEGLQTVWFTQMLLSIDGTGPGNSLGRFDQYMYPLYKADIEAGRLNKDLGREMLEELYIKITNILALTTFQLAFYVGGYYRFQQLTVGGVDRYGNDASNEVSHLALQAMREVHTTAPSVALMLHPKTSDNLLYEAIMLASQGLGHPSFFNVETMWQMLMGRAAGLHGVSKYTFDEIRTGGVMIGCVEPGVQGMQYGHTDSAMMNFSGILSLVLNNGVKPTKALGWGNGLQCGPKTGDPRDFKTFEEFFDAFKKQISYAIRELHAHMAVAEKIRAEEHYKPVYTIVTKGAIECGLDVEEGGAPIMVGPVTAVLGTADVANSLYNIKTMVYEKKEITMDELCKALDANFEGYELLREKLRNSPKYGNDLDEPDFLAREVLDFYAEETKKFKTYRGHYMDPSIQMVQANVGFGKLTWAQPNGKKAGVPLADTISAEQQTDKEGPTAALKSYGKLNHAGLTNGTILNMWISKSELVAS